MTGSEHHGVEIPSVLYPHVVTLFEYNQLHHDLRPCSVGVGLGSHDVGVATYTAELFHCEMFPLIVFTGANTPTTAKVFPEGEAVHYRRRAMELGVPENVIFVETCAINTRQNIEFTRQLLLLRGAPPESVLIVCRPYQQRRAYATCRQVWPEVDVICASQPLSLVDYIATIGDAKFVIDMIVGDTQRIVEYPKLGHAISQEVPSGVLRSLGKLIDAGFTSRLRDPR